MRRPGHPTLGAFDITWPYRDADTVAALATLPHDHRTPNARVSTHSAPESSRTSTVGHVVGRQKP